MNYIPAHHQDLDFFPSVLETSHIIHLFIVDGEVQDLLGCLGSIATRTMGVASKLSGVKGEQAGEVDKVADFKMHFSRPPIPDKRGKEHEQAAGNNSTVGFGYGKGRNLGKQSFIYLVPPL